MSGTEIEGSRKGQWTLAAAMVSGIILGAIFPQDFGKEKPEDEIFVMAEEAAPPPPPPPPPPEPPPPPAPKVRAPRVEPPPRQFGLQKEETVEKSDLAVATGNTVDTKADSIVAPAPPPAPVMVDQEPRLLSGPRPDYPIRVQERGVEGTVVALITIDSTGLVIHAKVEKSGGSDLDRSVLKAVWSARFQPSVRNGRRVPIMFRKPYEFRIEG